MIVTIDVRGHQREPLVITRADRAEHVLDALFDDLVLDGLQRVTVTREGIELVFADKAKNAPSEKVARERVLLLLGPPRWKVVDQE